MLFLSYAEEDRETAGEIAEWFRGHGLPVFQWEDPELRGRRFIRQIERAINDSDTFLVLLSPSFLISDWCRRETELALQREQDIQSSDPDYDFIHVLRIRETRNPDAGFLRGYDWLNLISPAARPAALGQLASRLAARGSPQAATAGPAGASPPPRVPAQPGAALPGEVAVPKFRNREDDLDKVTRGLASLSGPHFWLVLAPPQLGKTWFLKRVSDVSLAAPNGWRTSLVDVREQPAEVRNDAAALLALFFGLPPLGAVGTDTLRQIAREIIGAEKPYLCLLDSAEALEKATAVRLRTWLSQVYHLVQAAGQSRVRLGLIVASRRDDGWRGVTPDPRLSPLPLTEFKANVVEQSLRELADEMDRSFSRADIRYHAIRVHRMTEGLPALLVRCLNWIQTDQWLSMDRLDGPESKELFTELAVPYIEDDLLARRSLLPGQGQEGERLQALEEAFRVLAPYRLFTQSHLRHHDEVDPGFRAAREDQQWSMADLWKAISGTALLARPLNEPWQEIHPAIRRLLCRHHYESDDRRAEAHNEARKFVEVWANRQSGKEQVIGLVESLWHEANVLRLRNPAEMERDLSDSARKLSRGLKSSPAYTLEELRDYAAERMRNDEEFEEAVSGVNGLFSRLVEIVASPL